MSYNQTPSLKKFAVPQIGRKRLLAVALQVLMFAASILTGDNIYKIQTILNCYYLYLKNEICWVIVLNVLR